MIASDKPTGMCEFLSALKGTIAAADPEKRAAVAAMIDRYAKDFPTEFRWAGGPQAPTLLYRLLMTIDAACQPESGPRRVPFVIDRKSYPQPYEFVAGRPENTGGTARAVARSEGPEDTGSVSSEAEESIRPPGEAPEVA